MTMTTANAFTRAQREREKQCRALARATCELLNVPVDAQCVALVGALKFYAALRARETTRGACEDDDAVHDGSHCPELVVASAIYLACKLEESATSAQDVVNAVVRMASRGCDDAGLKRIALTTRANVRARGRDQVEFEEGMALAGYDDVGEDGVVVGALYYEYKDRILELEQEVLRAMDYELNTEQPHKYMFHIVHAIGGGEELANAASAALSNMMFDTEDLLLTTEAHTLAAAAVHLASIVLECESELKSDGAKKWYDVLGFDFEKMSDVNERFLAAVDSAREL